VHDVEDGRGGNQDDLEDPEPEVGDGRKGVVADVVATGLEGVALELGLLVAVHRVPHQRDQQDAENQQHGQPHLPDRRGMVLDLCQKPAKQGPITHVLPVDPRRRKRRSHSDPSANKIRCVVYNNNNIPCV
uniref:Uncharacterized protein n=1 Tax=Callorhinchus milii TaxID=7868 RepID=A0A4W3J227_CALMI